jgi:hypothetical protein
MRAFFERIVQPGWQPSNRRQNFRLSAGVKRANRVEVFGSDVFPKEILSIFSLFI